MLGTLAVLALLFLAAAAVFGLFTALRSIDDDEPKPDPGGHVRMTGWDLDLPLPRLRPPHGRL